MKASRQQKHLMRLEPLLVDSLKEYLDFIVNKDTRIKFFDNSFDSLFAPKLVEHGLPCCRGDSSVYSNETKLERQVIYCSRVR